MIDLPERTLLLLPLGEGWDEGAWRFIIVQHENLETAARGDSGE